MSPQPPSDSAGGESPQPRRQTKKPRTTKPPSEAASKPAPAARVSSTPPSASVDAATKVIVAPEAVTVPVPDYGPPPPVAEVLPPEPGHSVLIAIGSSGIDGVPGSYNDGTQWLRNGLKRHFDGTVIGLVVGWTGIWIALWAAAVGLVAGALIAGGIGTGFAYQFGVGQAAGVIGVVLGGLLGMLVGALALLRVLFVEHPVQALLSVASGALIALAIVIVIAAYERLGLRLRGYRRLSRMEVQKIAPLVKDVAERMNLPALPRFAMADMLVPNAWTHMRTVVLTTGLLQTLSLDELRAVIAHELEHWRVGDAVGLRCVWAAAWPIALTYNLGMVLTGKRSGDGRPPRGGVRTVLALFGWFVAWPAWVIIKLIITPIVANRQRHYEYHADAAAARIGYAADLSSALRKLAAFEGGRTGWEQAMAATHPPTELRIEALLPLVHDDYQYQEDELHGPTGAELRRLLTFWRPHSTASSQ